MQVGKLQQVEGCTSPPPGMLIRPKLNFTSRDRGAVISTDGFVLSLWGPASGDMGVPSDPLSSGFA